MSQQPDRMPEVHLSLVDHSSSLEEHQQLVVRNAEPEEKEAPVVVRQASNESIGSPDELPPQNS